MRLADVKALCPDRPPPVSLSRWLGAVAAGEQSGDREAVEFAREQKQLVTTTSGILIPDGFQAEWIDYLRAASVLNAAGMRSVAMGAKVENMSAVTADPTASWHTQADTVNVATPPSRRARW